MFHWIIRLYKVYKTTHQKSTNIEASQRVNYDVKENDCPHQNVDAQIRV